MADLANNNLVINKLQAKYKWGLLALPLTIKLVGVALLIYRYPDATGLFIGSLQMPWWGVIEFFALFMAIVCCCDVLGWELNEAITQKIVGLDKEQNYKIFKNSQVPEHWINPNLVDAKNFDEIIDKKWAKKRKIGAARFIVKYAFYYDLFGALGYIFARIVIVEKSLNWPNVAGFFVGQFVIGLIIFGLLWFISEKRYQNRIKQQSENADK